MNPSTDSELAQASVHYRDRLQDPDPRRESPRYSVEIDLGFQAPVILGEGDTREAAYSQAKKAWESRPEPRAPTYEELETSAQTWAHIDVLRKFIRILAVDLLTRGETHDRSKFARAEVDAFTQYTPKLKTTTYGSEEYHRYLGEMKPALEHHYSHNRHHPEFFARGIRGMNLVDLNECFCDWWASSRRHSDGDIRRSIEINAKRFNMSEELVAVFLNTVRDYEEAVHATLGPQTPVDPDDKD